MTIASTTRKTTPFAGDDISTIFPFTFKAFSSADLKIVKFDTVAETETVLTLTTDYTVALNTDQNTSPGGTITLTSVLAAGYTLTITTDISYLQTLDLTNQGGFYPQVITAALDRLTIIAQQLKESVDRAVKFKISSEYSDFNLPDPVAGKYLRWKTDLTALENAAFADASLIELSALMTSAATKSTLAEILTALGLDVDLATLSLPANTTVSAFIKTLLDDADISAALTTLGVSTFIKTLLDDADASAALSTLGVSTFIKTLLDDVDAATARATLGVTEPWMIDINVFNAPGAQTNWSNYVNNTNYFGEGYLLSTGAQNALISWPVVLSAGTWQLNIVYSKDTDKGIISVQIDGVEKGTIDGYAGSATPNQIDTSVSFAATAGKHTLMLKMPSKNGSSSSYYGMIQHVRLIRTA